MLDNATARFLGEQSSWAAARVGLADLHGLWGGRNLTLEGDGRVTAELKHQPSQPDGQYHFRITPAEVQQLLTLFVDQDFLSITPAPLRMVVPDETCTAITLTNGHGENHSATHWANDDSDPHFDRIYQALLRLAQRTQELEREASHRRG